MPLYDCRCSVCDREFQHLCKIKEMGQIKCPECGSEARTLISHTSRNRDWFRPHWNEHIDYEPVYIETKQQYKDLCLKNNVTSRALGDIRNIKEI